MKAKISTILTGVSLLALMTAAPAEAQDVTAADDDREDVIVVTTARRREESLQDVPLSVNALSGEFLDDLQIRDFEDIEDLVPGLDFQAQGSFGFATTLRGIRVDITVSGQSQTVEIYRNEILAQSNSVLQANYDIGGIEVLRGPQGTLRGRASPSGSITYNTRLPDLNEVGGYVDTSHTNLGGHNFQGALSVPIIEDRFAVRIAGLWDTDNVNRVRSLNSNISPYNTTHSYRITGLLKPADNLELRVINERLYHERAQFGGVQSASIPLPTAEPGDPPFEHTASSSSTTVFPIPEHAGFITAADRIDLTDFPSIADEDFRTTTWQLQWEIGGQRLTYVGGDYVQNQVSFGAVDSTNIFDTIDPTLPATCETADFPVPSFQEPGIGCFHGRGTGLYVNNFNRSHEVRIQSAEPLFGRLDYTIGAFFLKTEAEVDFTSRSLQVDTDDADGAGMGLDAPNFLPGGSDARIAFGQVFRLTDTEEYSFFGHLTYQLGNNTEIAGGVRRIHYEQNASLVLGRGAFDALGDEDTDGVPDLDLGPLVRPAFPPCDCTPIIWTASLKHRFADNFMAYATAGTSWRYTQFVVGDFSALKSPRQIEASRPTPEDSRSYEAGFKSDWFDGRVTVNAAGFYQTFDNYPISPGAVWFVRTATFDPVGGSVQRSGRFIQGLPVDVWGAEFEFNAEPTDRWNIGGNFAWAKGVITSGEIFCDDYFINADGPGVTPGSDGIPDELASENPPADVDAIRAATGGENLAVCDLQEPIRAFNTPAWQSSINSSYRHPITSDIEGFVRGQVTVYGKNPGTVNNELDDRGRYATVNLFAGLDSESGWEFSVFARNVFKEQFTQVSGGLLTTGYQADGDSRSLESEYRNVSLGQPREIGVNLRYRFGPG